MEPCGDQPGDMSDVDQQIGADRLGDLLESWKIECARIGTGAYDEQAWPAFLRHLLHRVIVDGFGLTVYAVGKHTEQDPGKIDLAAVSKVTPLGEVHAQDGVARFQHRQVGRHIGLRS